MNMINVLVVRPNEVPERIEFEDTLENLQEFVGGYIEVVYPFDDTVAVVCNEEGKLLGLPMNRPIYDRYNRVSDILCGTFLIVGTDLDEEEFCSLTDEQFAAYEKLYGPSSFM